MRSQLMATCVALFLAACGGGGSGFEDSADTGAAFESAAPASDPVFVALEAYIAATRNVDAVGFRDYQHLLEAHAALVRELEEAMAAAGALSSLDVFLDAGGSLGFGSYDAHGVYDPFGSNEDAGPPTPGVPGAVGTFYGLFGPQQPSDPFDVGLPGRRQEGSMLMPDISGALAGVANSGRSRSSHVSLRGFHSTDKIVGASGDVTLRETFTANPRSITSGMAVTTTETHITGEGVIDRYTVSKYDDEGRLVRSEHWAEDGTLTIKEVDENGDAQTSTLHGVEYKEVAVNELSNPDHAPDMGCLLPWLCDEETPGETLMIWSKGVNRALTPNPTEDGGFETHYVAPFLTQFDVLSNPGYIDGLIIYDPSSGSAPRVPRSGPVHE